MVDLVIYALMLGVRHSLALIIRDNNPSSFITCLMCFCCAPSLAGEVFDYLVSHGRMKEVEARAKFRQVQTHHPLMPTVHKFSHFDCPCFRFVCLLVSIDCFRCPLLPHEEYCPQRSEGENAQKMLRPAFRDKGLSLVQD